MPRTASLLIYNSSLFPAHWALWIPSAIDPDIGKLLQASGDAVSCFQKDFERNYDIRTITGRHQILQIAEVLDQYVIDVEGEESQSTDQTAYDYLEEIARSVPAPARILVPATSQVRVFPRSRYAS